MLKAPLPGRCMPDRPKHEVPVGLLRSGWQVIIILSPLLGARSGLTTGEALSLDEVAKKIAALTAADGCT